jgi:hypothetical protein
MSQSEKHAHHLSIASDSSGRGRLCYVQRGLQIYRRVAYWLRSSLFADGADFNVLCRDDYKSDPPSYSLIKRQKLISPWMSKWSSPVGMFTHAIYSKASPRLFYGYLWAAVISAFPNRANQSTLVRCDL